MIKLKGKLNRKTRAFELKANGCNPMDMLMTIYALSQKLILQGDRFETLDEVFKEVKTLDKSVKRVEEF